MAQTSDLVHSLAAQQVLTLDQIREVLGGVSVATAFRRLRQIPYRTSYNHNGRFYALYEEEKFDRWGLWSHRGVRISRDGSLTATVARLVREAEAGWTQRELQELLGVRVRTILATLLDRGEITRERLGRVFVYLHPEAQEAQARRRRERLEATPPDRAVAPEIVIEVLLVLIRHPGGDPTAVARRLKERSPPVTLGQVRWVFDRYELGQKKGLPKTS